MFKLGQKVVYPLHGVGIINQIEEKEVLGQRHRYYIIKLSVTDMTVMIPVERSEELGLRKVMGHKVIDRAVEMLKEETTEMDEDWKSRYQANMDKVKSGSIVEIAEVVRNLFRRNRYKELSIMERKLYENAYKLLVDEIALSWGIDKEEIQNMISEALEEGARLYQTPE